MVDEQHNTYTESHISINQATEYCKTLSSYWIKYDFARNLWESIGAVYNLKPIVYNIL